MTRSIQELAQAAVQKYATPEAATAEYNKVEAELAAISKGKSDTWLRKHPIICCFMQQMYVLFPSPAAKPRFDWAEDWCIVVAETGSGSGVLGRVPDDAHDYDVWSG